MVVLYRANPYRAVPTKCLWQRRRRQKKQGIIIVPDVLPCVPR